MASRRATLFALALAALSATGLAACGDDGDSESNAPTTEAPAGADANGSSDDPTVPGGEGGDLESAMESMGLETKAGAVETAIGEGVDRIEIDGDTMHVYLTEDGYDPSMGCMIVGAVLSDGETAVIHKGGDTTECD